MQTQIIRKMGSNSYIYTCSDVPSLLGVTNYMFGFLPIKISVTDSDKNTQKVLIQQNKVLKTILRGVSILNIKIFFPFKLYDGSNCLGKTKTKLFECVYFFYIKNYKFELRQHNNNYCSLLKNEKQVALYKKKDISIAERNVYEIKYDISINSQMDLIMLFCIFIDRVFYPSNGYISGVKYEKDLIFQDRYNERTDWMPAI